MKKARVGLTTQQKQQWFILSWDVLFRALKKHDKREPGSLQGDFWCTEMLCLCSRRHSCYNSVSNQFKFSSRGLNNRTFEDIGDGPMAKYWKVLDETEKVTSTNRGFRTKEPMCRNLRAGKGRTLVFLFQTNSWGIWRPFSSTESLDFIYTRYLWINILSNLLF